jgi:heme/copper-type cytochrome/quinol oxidase subunit 2
VGPKEGDERCERASAVWGAVVVIAVVLVLVVVVVVVVLVVVGVVVMPRQHGTSSSDLCGGA